MWCAQDVERAAEQAGGPGRLRVGCCAAVAARFTRAQAGAGRGRGATGDGEEGLALVAEVKELSLVAFLG